jgi:hypothetical protein
VASHDGSACISSWKAAISGISRHPDAIGAIRVAKQARRDSKRPHEFFSLRARFVPTSALLGRVFTRRAE